MTAQTVKSMTGFSCVRAESELGTLSIELKSVNSRYLDIGFKIPESIKPFEAALRTCLSQHVSRGKVECSIRFYSNTQEQLAINDAYAKRMLTAAHALSEQYGIETLSAGDLLKLPHMLVEQSVDTTALKDWLMPLFEQAATELVEQRRSEGQHLYTLIHERMQSISAIVGEAAQNYQQAIESVRAKLYEKLDSVAERHKSAVDEVRFEQEMIYLLQKMDIAEELDRLTGHIQAVENLLNVNEPVGRKLDFLMQEMNRESNTIASKSQNLGLTMNAVDLKVLLEQIREQIQNIE